MNREKVIIIVITSLILLISGVYFVNLFQMSGYKKEAMLINVSGKCRFLNMQQFKGFIIAARNPTYSEKFDLIKNDLVSHVQLLRYGGEYHRGGVSLRLPPAPTVEIEEQLNVNLLMTLEMQSYMDSLLMHDHFSAEFILPDNLMLFHDNLHEQFEKTVRLYVNFSETRVHMAALRMIVLVFLLAVLGIFLIYILFRLFKTHKSLKFEMAARQEGLLKQQAYMARIEKVNEKLKQFAYITSHDLKSPLHNISGLCMLMDEEIKQMTNKSNIEELLSLVKNRVMYMENLINGILEYSKLTTSDAPEENVDTKELVLKIAEALPSYTKIVFKNDMPVIFCHRVLIQQVFSNLMSNAVKYNDKPVPLVTIGVNQKGDWYEFSIQDNGPGIPRDAQDKMFKLFHTTGLKGRESGTGIGLYIVKNIVEEQNGKVWFDSGHTGTTFYFEWPKQ